MTTLLFDLFGIALLWAIIWKTYRTFGRPVGLEVGIGVLATLFVLFHYAAGPTP